MKQLIYKSIIILLIFIAGNLTAQNFQRSANYKEVFPLSEKIEVSIINKYGDVQIVHWDQDSVKIEVDVEVNSSKESKAEKLFAAIHVDFKSNFFYIVAETSLAGKSSLWTDISDKTKMIFNSSTTSRINYIVHIPTNAHLIVKNKYGNVYMGDYSGELDVDVSNGDFKAHVLTGKTKLKSSFGNIYVNRVDQLLLESSNAEVEIEECQFLETNTRTSKLYIEEVDELSLNSSHDKYHIGSLNSIYGNGNFTFLKIKRLNHQIDLKQKYGSLHFRHIDSEVDRFYLNTYKSDIHLSLSYEQAYALDFRAINPPVIQYPTGEYLKSEEIIDEEKGLKSVKIEWGGDGSGKVVPLNIQAEEGNIFINVK